MHVEDCCQALLAELLIPYKGSNDSYAIEIGCGTFAFYCELFDKLGLKSVAVEPLPVKELKDLCYYRGIPLVESCVADHDGLIDLYIGSFQENENFNLNSTRPNWWGATSTVKTVKSMTLQSLINEFSMKSINCLKIDIEGAEYSVLKQMSEISSLLIPKVLMFEYGGGGTFESQQGGWKEEFLQDTINILNFLHTLGYQKIIKIDSEQGSKEKIWHLSDIATESKTIFDSGNIYGNIIAISDNDFFSENKIHQTCENYRDNETTPLALNIQEPLLKLLLRRLRRLRKSFYKSVTFNT